MAEIVDFLRHIWIFFGNIPDFFVDVPRFLIDEDYNISGLRSEKKSVGDIEI